MAKMVCILLMVLAGASVLGARQADEPDVESKIIALERLSKMQAFAAKDVKTLDQLLDKNFVLVNPDGKVETKADLLLFVQSADSLQYTVGVMMVRVHGDTAVATGLYSLTGVQHGNRLSYRGRFVDTWLLKEGQWVAIASLTIADE